MLNEKIIIEDLEAKFNEVKNPIILNDFVAKTEEQNELIKTLLMTTYDHNDVISMVPTCSCGKLRGGDKLRVECNHCFSPVTRPCETDIDLPIWIRGHEYAPRFITPIVWIQLTQLISPRGYNLLKWITSSTTILPKKISKGMVTKIEYFKSIGWKRGLNAFIENFDQFMEALIVLKVNPKAMNDFKSIYTTYKDVIFPTVLPMPSKSLIVLENTYLGSYADISSSYALSAGKTIVAISNMAKDELSPIQVQNKYVEVIDNLSEYYTNNIKVNFCKKKGWVRGQLFSSRSNFSMRAVITSNTEPHDYEEVIIPWAQSLVMLAPHVKNKLLKRGYTEKDAHTLIASCGCVYNETLSEIFDEICEESCKFEIDGDPVKGISLIPQRNPSLERGSGQNLFAPRINKDIKVRTLIISGLTIRTMNADFDGDEANVTFIPDNRLRERFSMLRPHYSMHSLIDIGSLTQASELPTVTHSTLAHWLEYN